MKEYYLSDGENKRGAFSLKDLKHEVVLPDTLMWKEGWADWKTAKEAALIEPAIDLIINDTPPSIPKPPIQAVPTIPKAEPKKKKKSLLKTAKTLWKATDGDIDDLGELLEGQGNNRHKEQRKERGWRGFLAARQNAQDAVFHMLFRRKIGENYFNRAIFFSVMVTLISLKIFLDFSAYKKWWNMKTNSAFLGVDIEGVQEAQRRMGFEVTSFPFCVMDGFIILILILGIYHLFDQRRKKKQGIVVDSDSRGISHFNALGQRLKPETPEFGATLFIEPLIAFVASFLLYTHSFFFGLIAFGAAGRFWYENYLLYQKSLVNTSEGAVTTSADLSNTAVGFASVTGNVEQGGQEQAHKAAEKPSFTTMVYYAIGERLDKYLAENQEKVSITPFLQKVQQARNYFKKLNVNQRKSANFFISSAVVFVITFITYLINGEFLASLAVPFFVVMVWSAYLAFSQIKVLDKLISEIMSWVYLLGMGLIPVPLKTLLTGFVKLILFSILAFKFYYVGIAYLIYRIVIPFLDLKTLPSFEKA